MSNKSIHPLANLLPPMEDEQYQALKADIQKHGQIEAIWVMDGQIIDGRHRYRACQELGLEPVEREYQGPKDAASVVGFILSTNQHRRHLSTSQLAVLALDVDKILVAEGKKRKRANLSPSPDSAIRRSKTPKSEGKASDRAAKVVGGVSGRTVEKTRKIAVEAPDLIEPIRKGEISVSLAEREAARRRNMAMGRPDSPALSPREKKLQWVIARIKLSSDKVLDEIEAKLRDSLR